MSYIKIHEVDKTVQNSSNLASDNIAYIPLNSSDGPSGVYNIITEYNEFVNMYGSDPDPDSNIMTSWDYAANLLLRKMPVMVRRITREIDEHGNDTDIPLAGASLASGVLKINDLLKTNLPTAELIESDPLQAHGQPDSEGDVSSPKLIINSNAHELNRFEIYTSTGIATPNHLRKVGNGFAVQHNGYKVREYNAKLTQMGRDSVTEGEHDTWLKNNSSTIEFETLQSEGAYANVEWSSGGIFSIYNHNAEDSVNGGNIYITEFKINPIYRTSDGQAIYNTTLSPKFATDLRISQFTEHLIAKTMVNTNNGTPTTEYQWDAVSLDACVDNLYLKVLDSKGNVVTNHSIQVVNALCLPNQTSTSEACLPAIVLPANYTIQYSLENSAYSDSVIDIETYNAVDKDGNCIPPAIEVKTFISSRGYYTLDLIPDLAPEAGPSRCEASAYMSYYPAGNSSYSDSYSAIGSIIPEFDENGMINLFKLHYRYIGSEGSKFEAALKVISGDGIYIDVFRNGIKVESVPLVNFRYRNANGRFTYYDLYTDKDKIWQLFIDNFAMNTTSTFNTAAKKIESNYLTIEWNESLDRNYSSYLDSIYACQGNLKWPLSGGSNPTNECVSHELPRSYIPLADKYLYDIKFVTNGAFVDRKIMPSDITMIPQLDTDTRFIEDAQIQLAESRGDCIAFIDAPMDVDRDTIPQYYSHLATSYAAAYAPWVRLTLLTKETKWCPPSFAALYCIAKSVANGSPIYAPPAGVNRANIPECSDLAYQIPSEYIDTWQDNYTQFINPVVYINGYGVCIFGQKTLYQLFDAHQTDSALQYLNVRLVANEIKKRIFKSCLELSFEYNNLHTWLAFKAKMMPLMETLLYNNAISYYDIVMDETTMSSQDIRSNHIVGIISVAISNTSEKFDITFELLPNQVNFVSQNTASYTNNGME